MDDNIKKLHQALIDDGYDDVGTEQEFRDYVSDSKNVATLYNALSEAGYDNFKDQKSLETYLSAKAPVAQKPSTPQSSGQSVSAKEKKQTQYPQEVIDAFNSPDNKPGNFKDLAQLNDEYQRGELKKPSLISQALGMMPKVDAGNIGREQKMGGMITNLLLGDNMQQPQQAQQPLPSNTPSKEPSQFVQMLAEQQKNQALPQTEVQQQAQNEGLMDAKLANYLENWKQRPDKQGTYFENMVADLLADGTANSNEEAVKIVQSALGRYANRSAMDVTNQVVSSLPDDTVQDAEQSIEAQWYSHGVQDKLKQEADSMGISYDDYVGQFLKPAMVQSLVNKYGPNYRDIAEGIATRLYSHDEHVQDRLMNQDINEAFSSVINKYVNPSVVDEYNKAQEAGSKAFTEGMEGSQFIPANLRLGTALGAQYEANEAKDPAKVLSSLQKKFGKLYRNPEFLNDMSNAAFKVMQRYGLNGTQSSDPKQFKPMINSVLKNELDQLEIKGMMPKGSAEYIMKTGLGNTIVGKITRKAIQTDYQNWLEDMANQQYQPGFWENVASGALTFAGDAWSYWLPGAAGGKLTKSMIAKAEGKLAGDLMAKGMERKVAERAAKVLIGKSKDVALKNGAVHGAVTFGGQSAISKPIDEVYRTGQFDENGKIYNPSVGKVIANTLGEVAKQTAVGAIMQGGTIANMIGKGRGLATNILADVGGKVVDSGIMTGQQLLERMAHDPNFKPTGKDAAESFLESMANLTAIGLPGMVGKYARFKDAREFNKKFDFTDQDIAELKRFGYDGLRDAFEKVGIDHLVDNSKMGPQSDENRSLDFVFKKDTNKYLEQNYMDLMNNPNVSEVLKAKMMAVVEGKRPSSFSPVINSEVYKGDDGKYYLETYNKDGGVIDRKEYSSHDAARNDEKKLEHEKILNLASVLESELHKEYLDDYLYNLYNQAGQKYFMGEKLSDEEKAAVYLHQHAAEIGDIMQKRQRGYVLTDEEQKQVNAYLHFYNSIEDNNKVLRDFVSTFEDSHGVARGTLRKALESNDKKYDTLVESYFKELYNSIELKREMKQTENDFNNTENERDQESNEYSTVETEVSPTDTTVPEPPVSEGPAPYQDRTNSVPSPSNAEFAANPANVANSSAEVSSSENKVAISDAFVMGQNAYKNGDKEGLKSIKYNAETAELRLKRAFDDDEAQMNIVAKAYEDGKDMEQFVAQRANYMTPAQQDAVRKYVEAMEANKGAMDALEHADDGYVESLKQQLSPYTMENGNIFSLTLTDGQRGYWKSKNDYGAGFGVFPDANGKPVVKQVSLSQVKEEGKEIPLQEYVNELATQKHEATKKNFEAMFDATSLKPNDTVSLSINDKDQPTEAKIVSVNPDGTISFNIAGSKNVTTVPVDTFNKFQKFALRNRINVELDAEDAQRAEKEAIKAEAEKKQRFADGIVGLSEQKPDYSSKETDPKVAAEYLQEQYADNHDQLIKLVNGSRSDIKEQIDNIRKRIVEAEDWLDTNADLEPEQAQSREEKLKLAKEQLDDLIIRYDNWNKIRSLIMTDEEKRDLKDERTANIKKVGIDKEALTVTDEREVPVLTDEELKKQYPIMDEASDYILSQRKEISKTQEELHRQLQDIDARLNQYLSGETDLTDEEIRDFNTTKADLEARMANLSASAKDFKAQADKLKTLYVQENKKERAAILAEMTPAEQRKVKAEQYLKDGNIAGLTNLYADTSVDFTDSNPNTVDEYVASSIGRHALSFEGREVNGTFLNGLQQEIGGSRKDFEKIQVLAAEGKGQTFNKYVHDLYDNLPDNLRNQGVNTQEIRNSLIALLKGAEKYSDLKNYILNDKIAKAEGEMRSMDLAEEEQRAAYEEEKKLQMQEQVDDVSAKYSLSSETAGNGEQFYQDAEGNIDLANVPQEVFEQIGYTAAPFRLTPKMIKHMMDRHNTELKFSSPDEAIDFVRDVMNNFDHVRLGYDGALVFSIEDGRKRTGKRAVTILINNDNGKFYGLKTSGYESVKGLEKRPLLWERGANEKTSSTDAATASVTTSKSSLSSEQSGSASHQSNDFHGKDTNNSGNLQENGKNFSERLQNAISETTTEPTEAQKKAGNYKKGHLTFGGYNFTVETPKGAIRSGKDEQGKPWSVTMHDTYGYILGKIGVDGDHIDMFINDAADLDTFDGNVVVIDQVNPKTGEFDEHKVMYGYPDDAAAITAYAKNYSPGWKGLGKVTSVPKATFDKWLESSDRKTKPFRDYAMIQHEEAKKAKEANEALPFDAPMNMDDLPFHRDVKEVKPSEMTEAQKVAYDAVSTMLKKAGIPVKVVSNEDMVKVAEAQGKGVVYGYTDGKEIVLNQEHLNPNTPIHEYQHLWRTAAKEMNPDLIAHGDELIKQTQLFADLKEDPNYKHLSDDEICDEAFARLTGEDGAAILEQMAKDAIKENPLDTAKELTIINRLKDWLKKFWYWTLDTFTKWKPEDIKKMTLEDIRNLVLRDLANGVDPRNVKSRMTKEDAVSLRKQMADNAEQERILEHTEENWLKEFGKDSRVTTPIGSIKLGENQYKKAGRNDRIKRFGLLKPTLERPDVILEKSAPKEGAERQTKYLFIKSFKKADGNEILNYESITVKQGEEEVAISAHQIDPSKVVKELTESKLLWNRFRGDSNSLGENQGSALTPSANNPSGKDSVLNPHSKKANPSETSRVVENSTNTPEGAHNNDGNAFTAAKVDNNSETAKGNDGNLSVEDKIKAVSQQFGVDEADVAMYANAVKKGSTAEAARARANIKRHLMQVNEGNIFSFKDVVKYTKPVNEALKENFGDLDAMIEERRKQVEAERNAMEAARKRAEEEEAKRQKHLEELSLIPDDQLDKQYMDALAKGDDATAREMLDEAARRKGYDDTESAYQGVGAWAAPGNPGYESDKARRDDWESSGSDVNLEDMALGYTPQPDDYFSHPERYSQNTPHGLESVKAINTAIDAIKNGEKDVKVKVYRAVPTSVKEGKLRNGDWVTPSKKYAEMHGANRLEGKYRIIEDEVPATQLWWDGNDANEFGFDDGKEYKYKNAKNNRKLNDLVTYDDEGDVIPPSKRFNSRKSDIRFMFGGEKGAAEVDKAEEKTYRMDNLKVAEEMERGKKDAKAIKLATGWERGADGKWRYEMPDAKIKDMKDIGGGNIVKRFDDDMLWNDGKLADVIDAPGLFEAYPQLKDVRIDTDAIMNDMPSNGVYNAKTNTITIHADELKYMNSILNHEIQHAIQYIEGFAKGGSPEQMEKEFKAAQDEWKARAYAHELEEKAKEMGGEYNQSEVEKALVEEYKDLDMSDELPDKETRIKGFNYFARGYADRSMDDAIKRFRLNESTRSDFDSYKEYLKLAGEVESRNVEKRLGMTDEERRNSLAEETEDVNRAEQIVSGNARASYKFVEQKLKKHPDSLMKAGTYFSGGGLVEEGLKGIIDPVVAVEYDRKISGVYRNNFGQHIVTADVRDVDPKELVKHIDGEVEYFHASPVCKNYSQAKSNGGEVELDKETAKSTADFIDAVKPRVVTIENVKGYKDSEAMKIITKALDKNGYKWDADVYNAADFGGYTSRERLIVRAVKDGELPEKPKKQPRKGGWLEAVEDILPTLTEKKNGVAPWMDTRLKADGIDWQKVEKPLYVMGSAYADGKIPHAYGDEILPTLRTKSGDVIIMPGGKVLRADGRVLARITGLGDDYLLPKTESLAHTIIGNGIPVQLTKGVIAPLLNKDDLSGRNVLARLGSSIFKNNWDADMQKQVSDRVVNTANKLGGAEATVYTSVDEVPDAYLSDVKNGATGWYDPTTHTVHVYLPNCADANEAERTVLHEKIGHEGMEALLGGENEVRKFANFVYRSASKDVRGKIIDFANKYDPDWKNNDRINVGTQEYIAHLAEEGPKTAEDFSLWTKIKHYLIKVLKKLGVRVPGLLNDKDLRYYLMKAGKALHVWDELPQEKQEAMMKQASNAEIKDALSDGANLPSEEDNKPKKKTERGRIDEATGAFKLAPNGVQSNLSKKQYIEARTKNFKDWFGGDWEKKPKDFKNKLDANGEPLEKYVEGYLNRPKKPTMPKKRKGEDEATFFGRKMLYSQALEDWPKTEADWKKRIDEFDENTLAALTPPDEEAIREKYQKQYENDMASWRKDHPYIKEGEERPLEIPDMRDYQSIQDYGEALRKHEIWKTAPHKDEYERMAEDEIVSKVALMDAVQHPFSEYARLKAMKAEFQHMRHVMKNQKVYDQNTTDAVVQFAKRFMSLGYGDDLGRGSINTLLTIVKNSTGKKSHEISQHLYQVMDVLMNNQLRNFDRAVMKTMSIKELKENAKGIQVQGKLELRGQTTIKAFRDAVSSRISSDKLDEKISNLIDKMTDDRKNASSYQDELLGLNLAKQYVDYIDSSRNDAIEIEDLKKLEVENYKDRKGIYKGELTKALLQEHVERLNQYDEALFNNKVERMDRYSQLLANLGGMIDESVKGAREFQERDARRAINVKMMASADLGDKSMNQHHKENWKTRLSNSDFVQGLGSPLGSFDALMREFGSKQINGEGQLWNHFVRGAMKASNDAFKSVREANNEIDLKVSELFGKVTEDKNGNKKGNMTLNDLYALERSNKVKSLDVTIRDIEGEQTYKLQQGNLMYIYMVNKMPDGAMKLREMGILDADVERIKENIDPRFLKLADWIQGEFLPKMRTKYNKRHEELFGAPMPMVENYFPLRVLKNARYMEEDVNNTSDGSNALPSTATGAIIKRKTNKLPLDILNADALSVTIDNINEMENWYNYAPIRKDANTLLSDTTFRNRVQNMTTIYGSGEELWNNVKDATAVAMGTYRPTIDGATAVALRNFGKGITAAKISFRLYTAFKQVLSAPLFLPDVDLGRFVRHSVHPYGSFKWAIENLPNFDKRWSGRKLGDTVLMDDPTDWKLWHTNLMEKAAYYGMTPNALVDAVTCAVGARAVYDTKYKQYIKYGLTEERAKEKALSDAEINFNTSQQSSEGAFVSPMQLDKTLGAAILTPFRNSSMLYERKGINALRNLKHRFEKGHKEASIKFMAGQLMEEGVGYEQATKAAEKMYQKGLMHNIADAIVSLWLGAIIWNLGGSLGYLIPYLGDDENKKKKMVIDAVILGLLEGPVDGLAGGQFINTAIANTITSDGISLKELKNVDFSGMPMLSDFNSMIEKFGYDKVAGAQDLMFMVMQSATGFNPKTLTDAINACIDYGNGDMTNAKEIALFVFRLMNGPAATVDNLYIDELGMKGKDAKKLSYEELAKRYAEYKFGKNTFGLGKLYSDEEKQKKLKAIEKSFDKKVSERLAGMDREDLKNEFSESRSQKEKKLIGKIIADELETKDSEAVKKAKADASYLRQRNFSDLMDDLYLQKEWEATNEANAGLEELKGNGASEKEIEAYKTKHKAALDKRKAIQKARKEMQKKKADISSDNDEATMAAIRKLRDSILKTVRQKKK